MYCYLLLLEAQDAIHLLLTDLLVGDLKTKGTKPIIWKSSFILLHCLSHRENSNPTCCPPTKPSPC